MKIKAVIFDMNGVIVNDEPLHEAAFRKVLKEYGGELSAEVYDRFCLGRKDRDGFQGVVEYLGLKDIAIDDLVQQKHQVYMELARQPKAISGVVELIKALSGKSRLAVASGALRPEIEMILDFFQIKQYFSVIVSAEDVKNGKPDPEPYLLAASKLGIEPLACAVIEDSFNGVAAAKNAGMYCLGFHGALANEDLSQADKEVDVLDTSILCYLE